MVTVSTPIGIIAFAYGQRKIEPGPSNQKLADWVKRIRAELESQGHEVFVGAQWQIAMQLDYYDWCVRPDLLSYQGSVDVVSECKDKLFGPRGCTTVIPVVQPFLQSFAVYRHLKRDGFNVDRRKIRGIYHDLESLQPHTQSACELAWYAARQMLTGHEGNLVVTDQMRRLVELGQPPRTRP